MTNPERVRQARELRGLTQRELAARLDVDPSAVALIETGRFIPSTDLLGRLAIQTKFPPSFFAQTTPPDFPLGSLLFRSHASIKSRERAIAHRFAQLLFEIYGVLAQSVNEIPLKLPRTGEKPETAARITRSAFGLSPDTPIGHVVHAVESAGIVVLSLPIDLYGIDAFSLWSKAETSRPVVVVLGGRPGDRLRLGVAHEIGHLVLHQALRGEVREVENQAFRFASEFLLPEDAMREEIKAPVTLTSISQLKPRWGVSIQAIVRRVRALDIISERQYRYLFEQISKRGWKRQEPKNLEVPVEKPRALRKMAELVFGPRLEFRKMASRLSLTEDLLRELFSPFEDYTQDPKGDFREPSSSRKLIQFTVTG